MQYAAVPRGFAFCLAAALSGLANGSSSKPARETPPMRSRLRRVSVGMGDSGEFMGAFSTSVIKQKFGAVQQSPEQIFRACIVTLREQFDAELRFRGRRKTGQRGEKNLPDNFFIAVRRFGVHQFRQPSFLIRFNLLL